MLYLIMIVDLLAGFRKTRKCRACQVHEQKDGYSWKFYMFGKHDWHLWLMWSQWMTSMPGQYLLAIRWFLSAGDRARGLERHCHFGWLWQTACPEVACFFTVENWQLVTTSHGNWSPIWSSNLTQVACLVMVLYGPSDQYSCRYFGPFVLDY